MSETKAKIKPEVIAEQSIEKLDGRELVIIPKKEFLEWFKNTKGIMGDVDIKEQDDKSKWMECPNCKSRMDSYELNKQSEELWHICSKCNLSFSKRQHKYFTTMIMRLISQNYESK